MKPSKIAKFYNANDEYFKKKQEIAKAIGELELLKAEANTLLKETVDNGFTTQQLVDVSIEYRKHKFNSKVVQDFIEDAVVLLLDGLSASKRNTLEVTSIDINMISTYDYFDSTYENKINGPVKMHFTDETSKRSFTVIIPVKDSTFTDVVHWKDEGDGMYMVYASYEGIDAREICRVFDASKVPIAINKYLCGELDEDLMTLSINHMQMVDDYDLSKCKFSVQEYDLESNSGIDLDRIGTFLNGDSRFYNPLSFRIEHCIDDRDEYILQRK